MECQLAELTEEFYENLNLSWKYICDRCNITKLIADEYAMNVKYFHGGSNHYCQECWNWIHLKKWTDKDGTKHTLRSERR